MIKWRFSKKKKKEFEEIEYTPTSVKELLTEMKDISELIVDLAYSAVIFDCEDMAKEVEDLEIKMDKLLYQIRLAAMLATRTTEEAEQLSGILQVASMAENISNAAGDIVKLLELNLEGRLILPMVLRKGDEKIRHVFVDKSSTIVKRNLGDLRVETETGARIIAVNRGKHWIYDVERNFKFKSEDRLIIRGVEDGLNEFVRYASGAEPWPKKGGQPAPSPAPACRDMKDDGDQDDIGQLEKMILRIKDTSELMVDLAYSALLYNNMEIAQEVYLLEDISDEMYNKIQRFAVANTAKKNPNVALTMIRLVTSIEMIADSARGIADVVLRDIEPHPILKMSILESDTIISKVIVHKNSSMSNCTLGSTRVASETGMWVIAIRRVNEWLFGPDEFTNIENGDILIVRGPRASEKSLRRLARSTRPSRLIHRGKK